MAFIDITREGNALYAKLQEQKYTKFDEKKISKLENETRKLITKYLINFTELDNDQTSATTLNIVFHNIFQEHQKINRIVKMQNVIEELRKLKKKFYAISDLDTSMKYAKRLLEEANRFKDRLAGDKSNERFPDIFYELQVLIQRIENACRSTKAQVMLESVSGVVTLGTAAVSGAIGIANGVLRGAADTAASAATAVAISGVKVNKSATIAATLMNASFITKVVSKNLLVYRFLFERHIQWKVEETNETLLYNCTLSARINEFLQYMNSNDKKSFTNSTSKQDWTKLLNVRHTSKSKQLKYLASILFLEFTKDEFE
ncbi:hypothetical protein Bpfe_022221 [Biomphalaria pfeifferi]|uniref:Uncharacterized protein n=1 Tax=Biomphalaria pfeifferi TaxID=112525 RepID=A0AAD8B6G2_BIOPF|nr:hypothetical protein Bpfe_022221 [Biomphalaria pfeifferi]